MLSLVLAVAFLVPDRALTPGVVRPLTKAAICATVWGLDRRHVTPAMRRQVGTWYHIPSMDWPRYELDHLIPRSLGGADDARNLWFQPWDEARQKDRLEVALEKRVCRGDLSLAAAQDLFRRDWRVGYQQWITP